MRNIVVYILVNRPGTYKNDDIRYRIEKKDFLCSFIIDEVLYRNFLYDEEISDSYLNMYKDHDFLWSFSGYKELQKLMVIQELNNEVLRG